MQPFAHLIKVSVPNYLSGLPIPDSIGGWFRLGFRDIIALIPPTAALAGATYVTYLAFCPVARQCQLRKSGKTMINPGIKKEDPKIVDTVEIEDIAEKAVFCRCWRSKNWPYCDGSHGPHNKESGDNVGPLIVKHKEN